MAIQNACTTESIDESCPTSPKIYKDKCLKVGCDIVSCITKTETFAKVNGICVVTTVYTNAAGAVVVGKEVNCSQKVELVNMSSGTATPPPAPAPVSGIDCAGAVVTAAATLTIPHPTAVQLVKICPTSIVAAKFDREMQVLCAPDGSKVLVQNVTSEESPLGTAPVIEAWTLAGAPYAGSIALLTDCGVDKVNTEKSDYCLGGVEYTRVDGLSESTGLPVWTVWLNDAGLPVAAPVGAAKGNCSDQQSKDVCISLPNLPAQPEIFRIDAAYSYDSDVGAYSPGYFEVLRDLGPGLGTERILLGGAIVDLAGTGFSGSGLAYGYAWRVTCLYNQPLQISVRFLPTPGFIPQANLTTPVVGGTDNVSLTYDYVSVAPLASNLGTPVAPVNKSVRYSNGAATYYNFDGTVYTFPVGATVTQGACVVDFDCIKPNAKLCASDLAALTQAIKDTIPPIKVCEDVFITREIGLSTDFNYGNPGGFGYSTTNPQYTRVVSGWFDGSSPFSPQPSTARYLPNSAAITTEPTTGWVAWVQNTSIVPLGTWFRFDYPAWEGNPAFYIAYKADPSLWGAETLYVETLNPVLNAQFFIAKDIVGSNVKVRNNSNGGSGGISAPTRLFNRRLRSAGTQRTLNRFELTPGVFTYEDPLTGDAVVPTGVITAGECVAAVTPSDPCCPATNAALTSIKTAVESPRVTTEHMKLVNAAGAIVLPERTIIVTSAYPVGSSQPVNSYIDMTTGLPWSGNPMTELRALPPPVSATVAAPIALVDTQTFVNNNTATVIAANYKSYSLTALSPDVTVNGVAVPQGLTYNVTSNNGEIYPAIKTITGTQYFLVVVR